jgi:hypothetical protein
MSIKYILAIFILLTASIAMVNVLRGQQRDSSPITVAIDSVSNSKSQPILWWLALGYGASNISESGDFSACVGALVTVEFGNNFFSARVVHDQGVNVWTPNQMVFDAALLYGIGFHRELWFGNASVGLAYTATTKRVFDHTDSTGAFPQEVDRGELFRGIGFAWQAQVFSKFSDSSKVGLGVTVCGNVNKSLPFWMLLLSLEFGNF